MLPPIVFSNVDETQQAGEINKCNIMQMQWLKRKKQHAFQ